MDPARDVKGQRQYQDLSCPPLPGMGPTPPVEGGVFARPASRSPRAVMGLAGAARPPSQQPGVGGLAGAARPPSYSPRLDDFMDARRAGVLAAFLERDPVAADVVAAGLDAAALEAIIPSRRLAGRRRPASTEGKKREKSRENPEGSWARPSAGSPPPRSAGWPGPPRSAASRRRRRSRRRKSRRGRRRRPLGWPARPSGPCWCGPTTGRGLAGAAAASYDAVCVAVVVLLIAVLRRPTALCRRCRRPGPRRRAVPGQDKPTGVAMVQ